MAQETETLGNFSILNTMEMQSGNQALLNDLLSPETATSTPEEVAPLSSSTGIPEKELPSKEKEKENKQENKNSLLTDLLQETEEEVEEELLIKTPNKDYPNTEEENNNDENTTKFSALATDLYKLGVFTEDDEDTPISSPEDLLEKFNSEKRKGAIETVNNFIGQFGEDYQNAFEAIYVKGVSPKEYFSVYNEVVNFSEMDLSEEKNQVKIVKQALLDQGFEQEDVESEIERFKNYGDLESIANKHHKVLIKKEAAKLQEMEAKAEQELTYKQNIKNQYVNNVQNILQDKIKLKEFDGIPLNADLASELQDFLLVDKWKTNSGENLTDFDKVILDLKKPENHAMKVKVGLIIKMLEKDPTLTTIQNKGVTKKTNQLFGEVARQVTKEKFSAKPTSQTSNIKSWFT